jgi:hypothetical protein
VGPQLGGARGLQGVDALGQAQAAVAAAQRRGGAAGAARRIRGFVLSAASRIGGSMARPRP